MLPTPLLDGVNSYLPVAIMSAFPCIGRCRLSAPDVIPAASSGASSPLPAASMASLRLREGLHGEAHLVGVRSVLGPRQ